MELDLARHLVEQSLVAPGAMDDVLQRQAVYGGSLDTNILELDILDEQVMTELLSVVYRMPIATPELLAKRDPRMLNLFPARLAQKYRVLPVSMGGRSVYILASSRVDPKISEEIGFMLSLQVKMFIVCEARLMGLLHAWFGMDMEPRYAMLLERLGDYTVYPPQRPDEEDSAETRAAQEALVLKTPDTTKIKKALGGVEAADRAERERREMARSGKLTLEQASLLCMNAPDRDKLIDVTLRFARQFMPFVAMFVMHDDYILGWDAVGEPEARERTRRIRLSTQAPSVLTTVIKTRAYYLGAMSDSIGNTELLRVMGREKPRNVCVMPITLQNHLLGLLYGDARNKAIPGNRLVELLVFVNRISTALEQLIRRRKNLSETQAARDQTPTLASSLAEVAIQNVMADSDAAASALDEGSSPMEPVPEEESQPTREEPPATAAEQDWTEHVEPSDEEPEVVDEGFLAPPPPEPRHQAPAPIAARPPEDDLHPNEERVRYEDLGEGLEGAVQVFDDGEVVVVDPDEPTGFVPSVPERPAAAIAPLVIPEEHQPVPAPASFSSLEELGLSAPAPADVEPPVAPHPEPSPPNAPAEEEPPQPPQSVIQQVLDVLEAPEDGPAMLPSIPLMADASGTDSAGPGVGEGAEEPPPAPLPTPPAQSAPPPDGFSSPEALARLVDELCGTDPNRASQAAITLVGIGKAAIPRLMERFPGRLVFNVRGANDNIPPTAEHSELLRCLIHIGPEVCPAVSERLEDPDPLVRYYAVRIFAEVSFPAAVHLLAKRLYDVDALIRLTSVDVLQSYRKTVSFEKLLSELRAQLRSPNESHQAIAAALLGNFKDADALPWLVALVKSPSRMVSRAAMEALSYITKQDFGTSERKWVKWWRTHKGERRVQWLIEGLRSKNRDIRFSSAKELTQLTGEYFGYYFDSGREDREKAIVRWEHWWNETGRRMHFHDG